MTGNGRRRGQDAANKKEEAGKKGEERMRRGQVGEVTWRE